MSVFWPNAALAASDVKRLDVDLGSVKQISLRGRPALGPRVAGHGLGFPVVEYLLDDDRVFDCRDDLYRPAAVVTGFDVDVEYAL